MHINLVIDSLFIYSPKGALTIVICIDKNSVPKIVKMNFETSKLKHAWKAGLSDVDPGNAVGIETFAAHRTKPLPHRT